MRRFSFISRMPTHNIKKTFQITNPVVLERELQNGTLYQKKSCRRFPNLKMYVNNILCLYLLKLKAIRTPY